MTRPRSTNFKPQAKTANIRRIAPDALANPQTSGPPFSSNHAHQFDDWGAKLAAEEQHYGGAFLTYGMPSAPHSDALVYSAASFLDGVMSDLRAMDDLALTSSISAQCMDVDPSPDEVMDIDQGIALDYMDIDMVVHQFDEHLAVPMDIIDEPFLPMMIDEILPSPFVPQVFPAFSEYPITPPKAISASPHWDLVARLSLVRQELDLTLQHLTILSSQSPINESPAGALVQQVSDDIQPAGHVLLPSAVITSNHSSPKKPDPCMECAVEVVSMGIRILDISDDRAIVPRTTPKEPKEAKSLESPKQLKNSKEPLSLAVAIVAAPHVYREPDLPELLSPSTESSGSSPALQSFDSADLLGLMAVEPVQSSPTQSEVEIDPMSVWADIADLQECYRKIPIRDVPGDEGIGTLAREVAADLDLTLSVDVRCTIDMDESVSSESMTEEVRDYIPSVVTNGDFCEAEIREDGKLKNKVTAAYIVRVLKIRADRNAKRTERNAERRARVKERRRSTSPLVDVPMPQKPPCKKVTNGGSKADAFISNANLNAARLPRVLNSRLTSPYKSGRSSPTRGDRAISLKEVSKEDVPTTTLNTPSLPSSPQSTIKANVEKEVPAALSTVANAALTTQPVRSPIQSTTKENFHDTKSASLSSLSTDILLATPEARVLNSPSESTAKENVEDTKPTALSSSSPLSAIDQNVQHVPKVSATLLPSSVKKESTADRKPKLARWNGVAVPVPRFTHEPQSLPAELSTVKEDVEDTKALALPSASSVPVSAIEDALKVASMPTPSSASKECTLSKKPVAAIRTGLPLPTARPPRGLKTHPNGSSENKPGSTRKISPSVIITPTKPIAHVPDSSAVYMPHTHTAMKQRGLRLTAPRTPALCPARPKPAAEFFAPPEKYVPKRASGYPGLKSVKSKTFSEDDRALSCSEAIAESSTSASIETRSNSCRKMVLYDPKARTLEFTVNRATRMKIFPGAIPTTHYHKTTDASATKHVTKPTWFDRLKLRVFGW